MKNFWIQIGVLVIFILAAMYFSFTPGGLSNIIPINQQFEQKSLQIGGTTIKIEVAQTPSERSQGLGGRDSLASDSGMLFIFPENKKYQFWMKGMKFPLDFVFIRDAKVVDLLKNAPPPSLGQKDSDMTVYEPVVPIGMVLEVNANFIDTHDIRVGDTVYLAQ